MSLREIKGFPNYVYDTDTGDVVSRLNRHAVLKPKPIHRKALFFQMVQDGKRRCISYNRLMYAIQNDISYDEIPDSYYIVRNDDGLLVVRERSEMVEYANNHKKAAHRRYRLQVIDQKIEQLEIMKRAYQKDGSYIEAVQYIEKHKPLLINHHIKRFNTSSRNAEMHYAIALERMIDRINDPTSQVTELIVSMMGLMGKVRKKLSEELEMKME